MRPQPRDLMRVGGEINASVAERVQLIAAASKALQQPLAPMQHAAVQDVERRAIEQILAEYRDLSGQGFWCGKRYGPTREEFDADRAYMTHPIRVNQFRRSLVFILLFCHQRKTLNRRTCSQSLKHLVEFAKMDGLNSNGAYVSQSMFIVAAIFLGYRVERITGTPNAWLNLDVVREVSR